MASILVLQKSEEMGSHWIWVSFIVENVHIIQYLKVNLRF